MADDPLDGRVEAVPWKIRDTVYGVGLICAGVAASLLALGIAGAGPRADGELGTAALLAAALLEGLMIAAVWLFGVNKYRARWAAAGLVRPRHAYWLILVAAALALNLAFSAAYVVVTKAAGADDLAPSPLPFETSGGALHRLVVSAVLGVLAPFAEEVFFRGFLLTAMVPALGLYRAMIVSSALFAVSHGIVAVMVPLFITGLLLSWLYVKTRSIWPPVTAHVLQNMLALLAI